VALAIKPKRKLGKTFKPTAIVAIIACFVSVKIYFFRKYFQGGDLDPVLDGMGPADCRIR
jgi:hypothetical protein